MADTKVSALPAVSAAASTNEIPVNEGGTSKKLTVAQLEAYLDTRGLPRVTRLGSTHSVSTTAATAVTGLDHTLEAGTYVFDYWLIVRAATSGVAPTFNFNFTGTAAPVKWWFQYADTSATLLAAIGSASNNVTTQTLGFGMSQSEDVEATTATGNMGPLGGLQNTATDTLVKITGLIVVSVSGNMELWHSSETATATTVEVGSSLVVIRTA